MTPRTLTRPYVGLNPTTPQYAAGILTDPDVAGPTDPKQRPAATAAADPPDGPPAMRSSDHGFRTAPKQDTSDVPPYANSCRLSLPRMMAPSSRSRATMAASSDGTRSLNS